MDVEENSFKSTPILFKKLSFSYLLYLLKTD
jgi:hypothetical protein